MTPSNLADSAFEILLDHSRADRMRTDLARVSAMLKGDRDPFRRAADLIASRIQQGIEQPDRRF